VDGLHPAAAPPVGQQARHCDLGDVAGRDPGHRLIDGEHDRHDARANRVDLQQQVAEEEPAAQVHDRGARRVETLLGAGQVVDLARAR
jgi:hypothetical protein